MALGNYSLHRAQRSAALINDIVAGRRRVGELVVEALDGNESDLEELTLRWRLAGVRWQILIPVLLDVFLGFNGGRRGRYSALVSAFVVGPTSLQELLELSDSLLA